MGIRLCSAKLYFLLGCHTLAAFCAVLPSILWDPRNPMFSCNDIEIKVKVNDELKIVCPSQGLNFAKLDFSVNSEFLYENMNMLSPEQEAQYHSCNATGGWLIMNCDKPSTLKYATLVFREFSGSSSVKVYAPGKTYYLIGTGQGTVATINNQLGGRCNGTGDSPYRLRLKIRVCTTQEITSKTCVPCSTQTCYTQGCGIYSDWRKTNVFLWNGTTCLNKEVRTCNGSTGFCSERLERTVISQGNCTFPSKVACNKKSDSHLSATKTTTFIGLNNTAAVLSTRSLNAVTTASLTFINTSSSQPSRNLESGAMTTMPQGNTSTDYITIHNPIATTSLPSTSQISSNSCRCTYPTTGRQEGNDGDVPRPAFLIVPSVVSGIILGVTVTVALKYIIKAKDKRKVAPYSGNQQGAQGD